MRIKQMDAGFYFEPDGEQYIELTKLAEEGAPVSLQFERAEMVIGGGSAIREQVSCATRATEA